VTLSPWILVAANLIVLGAFFTRSFSGFGGAALAIPLLSLFLSLSFIIPVECLFEVLLSFILLPRVLKDVDWGSLVYIVAGAMAGCVVGIYLLESTPNETLKTILGVVVMLVALSMLRRGSVQGSGISKKWGIPVGVLGGVLGGMLGASGPAYVTYLAYQTSDKQVFRATLIAIFTIEYGWRLALFFYRGLLGMEQIEFALWLAPAVIIATLAGQMVHLQVSERQFRLAVVALLLVAGGLCFL